MIKDFIGILIIWVACTICLFAGSFFYEVYIEDNISKDGYCKLIFSDLTVMDLEEVKKYLSLMKEEL